MNFPSEFPSILLAYILSFSGSCAGLDFVSSAFSYRLKDDSLWSEVCSSRWAQRGFNFNFYESYRTAHRVLSFWCRREGYYWTLEAFPFGLLVKLELTTVHHFVGHVLVTSQSDPVNSASIFIVDIDPLGIAKFLPGVFHAIEDSKYQNAPESQALQKVLPLARDTFPGWNREVALSDWVTDVGESISLLERRGCGDISLCSRTPSLGSKKIVNITATPMPDYNGATPGVSIFDSSAACFCGGPFGSVLELHCGCDHSAYAMIRQLVGAPIPSPLITATVFKNQLSLLRCSPIAFERDSCRIPARGLFSVVYPESYVDIGKFKCQCIAVIHRTFMFHLRRDGTSCGGEEDVTWVVSCTMRMLGLETFAVGRLGAAEEQGHILFDYLRSTILLAVTEARQRPLTKKLYRVIDNPFVDEYSDDEIGNSTKDAVTFKIAVGVKMTGDHQLAMGELVLVTAVEDATTLLHEIRTVDACILHHAKIGWLSATLEIADDSSIRVLEPKVSKCGNSQLAVAFEYRKLAE